MPTITQLKKEIALVSHALGLTAETEKQQLEQQKNLELLKLIHEGNELTIQFSRLKQNPETTQQEINDYKQKESEYIENYNQFFIKYPLTQENELLIQYKELF